MKLLKKLSVKDIPTRMYLLPFPKDSNGEPLYEVTFLDFGAFTRRGWLFIGAFLFGAVLLLGGGAYYLAHPSESAAAFSIELTSDPSGASVFVGDERKPRGQTPLSVRIDPVTSLRVHIKAEGYLTYEVAFTKAASYKAVLYENSKNAPWIWKVQHKVTAQINETRWSPDGKKVFYRVGTQRFGYDPRLQEYSRLDTYEDLGGGDLDNKGNFALQLDPKSSGSNTLLIVDQRTKKSTILYKPSSSLGTINSYAWSPDGSYILIALSAGDDGLSRLLLLDTQTKQTTTVLSSLVPIKGAPFSFSPSGTKITFFLDAGHPVLTYLDLLSAASVKKLADIAFDNSSGSSSRPSVVGNPTAWDPDEKLVYFAAPQPGDIPQSTTEYYRTGPTTLYSSDFIHEPTLVTTSGSSSGDPLYSIIGTKDESFIVLVNVDKNTPALYRFVPSQHSFAPLGVPLPFPLDPNIQVVSTPRGTGLLFFLFRENGQVERWAYIQE